MTTRLVTAVALLVACVAVTSATPAFGDSEGTVSASVTVAAPCLTVNPPTLDFGVLGFTPNDQNPTDSAQLAIDLDNCSGAPTNVLARGTDASSTGGTTWQLQPGHFIGSTCASPNVYKTILNVILNNAGAQHALDSVNRTIASPLGPQQSPDVKALVRMPCTGSSGAGEVMTFSYIFTGVLP